MIVGSGLIAKAFLQYSSSLNDVCIYAAGVSNSSNSDEREFARDRLRLQQTLATLESTKILVYFSTCSVEDPWSNTSRYVVHKLELEDAVRARDGAAVVIRLAQVAGFTPNPHTILNYLHARIARSERFGLWRYTGRNVLDVEDVARVVMDLITKDKVCSETISVASPKNSPMLEIVAAFEKITKRGAIYSLLEKGGEYIIDTRRIDAVMKRNAIVFDDTYLFRTLKKYYG